MYCLVRWSEKTTTIENSSGVNFKSRQTRIKYSKDGKSYRGRALAMSDDNHFLGKIRLGTRCCLMLPSVVENNGESSTARDGDNVQDDHTRITDVEPGTSGGIQHSHENSLCDSRHGNDADTSQGSDIYEIYHHRSSVGDYGAHGPDNPQNAENNDLQAVELDRSNVDSEDIFIIDPHDDDDVLILMNHTLDFDEDIPEDVAENNHVLNVTEDGKGFNRDEGGRELVYVDDTDISILLSNEEGLDGGEDRGEDGDIGHNDGLIMTNVGDDFDEGGDREEDVYNNEDTGSSNDLDDEGGLDRNEDRDDDFVLNTDDMSILVSGGEDQDRDGAGEEDFDIDNEDVLLLNDENHFDEAGDRGEDIDDHLDLRSLTMVDDNVHNSGILDVRDAQRAFNEDGGKENDICAHRNGHQPGPSNDPVATRFWNEGGPFRVEIMANTGVFIDKRELAAIRERYGNDPREMERKLFLEILGEGVMIKMTRTGRHQKGKIREKFPKDVFDAVRNYMDANIEDNPMDRKEFQDVLTYLCNRLRNPRR